MATVLPSTVPVFIWPNTTLKQSGGTGKPSQTIKLLKNMLRLIIITIPFIVCDIHLVQDVRNGGIFT